MFTFSNGAQISSRWNLNANIQKYDPTQTNPNKQSGYNSVKYIKIIEDKSKASLFWVLPHKIHIFWHINKAQPHIREGLLHQVPCSRFSLLLFLWYICCSQALSCKVLSISSDMQSISSPAFNSALHSAVLDPTQPTLHLPEHLLCCFYWELNNNRRKQNILWLFMATPENISGYSPPDHSGQTVTCPFTTLQKYNYFCGYLILLPKKELKMNGMDAGRRKKKNQYSSK